MSETTGNPSHLFAPVQAPKLTNISRRAIQDFLADREQYETAIKAQPGLSPIPWAGCFDALFLRSLVRARAFGAQYKSVDELNDAVIKAKLESLSSTTKHVSFDEAMADVVRNVKIDASEADARLRVLMLQTSYISLCDRRGWNFIDKAQKAAVKHLTAVLEPPQLKSRVEDALRLEESDLKDDFFGFVEFLANEAEVCERFQPLRDYRKSLGKNKGRKNSSESPPSGDTPNSAGSGSSSSNKDKPKKGKKISKKLPPCLNEDCNEFHLLKDCTNTSLEDKKTLLAKYREEKAKKK